MFRGVLEIDQGRRQLPVPRVVLVLPTILFFTDAKHFAFPIEMFYHDAFFRQLPVISLLRLRQRLLVRRLKWYLGLLVKFLKPLKPFVNFDVSLLVELQFALLEKLKIVDCAFPPAHCQNHPRQQADNQQDFTSVQSRMN